MICNPINQEKIQQKVLIHIYLDYEEIWFLFFSLNHCDILKIVALTFRDMYKWLTVLPLEIYVSG